MYIKKIIAATAVIGMIVGGIFAYTIYGKFFSPNTAFNNEEAHLYVKTDATYSDVAVIFQLRFLLIIKSV